VFFSRNGGCGLHQSHVLWLAPVTCTAACTSHMYCGLHQSHVLWLAPVTCTVACTSHMYCGLHQSHVLWLVPVTCTVACTSHMYCGLHQSHVLWLAPVTCTVAWKEVKKEMEATENRKYSGAKCSIVERWFRVNANSFDDGCLPGCSTV
jgi:hypothetical protein